MEIEEAKERKRKSEKEMKKMCWGFSQQSGITKKLFTC